jgi:hypothetical protein
MEWMAASLTAAKRALLLFMEPTPMAGLPRLSV